MSTSSLSVLFLRWTFIILHVCIVTKLGKLFYFLLFPLFSFALNISIMQTVYKHTEVQHYSMCVLICFLDKWLLATSIIQGEKQWKYRGITFVYFLSCQSFLLGFYINKKKIRKSPSLKASLDEHLLTFFTILMVSMLKYTVFRGISYIHTKILY